MTSTVRSTSTTRRGVLAAAVATLLSGAPALLGAQQPAAEQPPAGGPGQPPMGAPGGPGMRGPGMRGPGMRGPGGPGGMGMRMLMEGITLSDAQRVRVDSINRAFGERMRARRQLAQVPGQSGADLPRPDSAARAARRDEMRREVADHNAAVRAVLTGDQQQTFDANVARLEQMRQERLRDGGPRR